MAIVEDIKTKISDKLETSTTTSSIGKTAGIILILLLVIIGIVGFIWDDEPDLFDINENTTKLLQENNVHKVTGSTTAATVLRIIDVLLNKTRRLPDKRHHATRNIHG